MNIINKYKARISVLLLGMFMFSACEKDFLEVNENPNNPPSATVNLVLPNAQGYLAYIVGGQYQIFGSFLAQHWTQGPVASQYKDYDRYSIPNTTFERPWTNLYSGTLTDLQYVIDQSANTDQKNYAGIAKVMQAYTYQVLTDLYGDIPFSQALKGNEGVISPKYDSQEEVYNGLIKLVDEGLALIDVTSDVHPGADDLIFHGDMEAWVRFANTLKLRIYMRQSEVRPNVAQEGIAAMTAAGAEYMSEGDIAQVSFIDVQYNQNPVYAGQAGLGTNQNLIASKTAIDEMIANNDPRIDVLYDPATTGTAAGGHRGMKQGGADTVTGVNTTTDYSRPGAAVGGYKGGAEAPVIFMTSAESFFLQAEAVARGWMAGDAKALYESGIRESFSQLGFADADADTYVAQAEVQLPTGNDAIKAIITQKWFALNGNSSVEAWTEYRRTGFPDFLITSVSSRLGASEQLKRLLYPSSETTRNAQPQHSVTSTTPVWWDK
ncbi:MAG: SusD/RagB family nutrient-binding outer membrane lipoprotein [Bacteroidia bacterium]